MPPNSRRSLSFTEAVAEVDRDEALWSQTASRPVLLREPDLGPALGLISRVLGLSHPSSR